MSSDEQGGPVFLQRDKCTSGALFQLIPADLDDLFPINEIFVFSIFTTAPEAWQRCLVFMNTTFVRTKISYDVILTLTHSSLTLKLKEY